jgi:hypothetical protein
MPFVRDRIIPEVELAGLSKRFLDVLIWAQEFDHQALAALNELDILRVYLRSLNPFICDIRLWVPEGQADTSAVLRNIGIEHGIAPRQEPPAESIRDLKIDDPELITAVGTALRIDADCLAVTNRQWLPNCEDINDKLSFLLTDCTFLLPYSEVFSRGHDVPWAYEHEAWNSPWNAFYQLAEPRTFRSGITTLQHVQNKNDSTAEARESLRSLVFNRLANLCFTRDRLLFYDQQRLAAKRAGWKRQQFGFEIAYYLNFYYLLIFGAFDHAALFVSHFLGLGLTERQVWARSRAFLDALEKKAPSVHAIFTADATKKFLDRVGYLRHYAAHRGSLNPTIVVQAPEREPTTDELDEDIREAGLDYLPNAFPPGPVRDAHLQMLRDNARMARYEKQKVLEGVVPIEYGGKFGFINPLLDTSWNFSRVMAFLEPLFAECRKIT